MLKKSLYVTFLIFSLFITSCQVSWFDDLKTDMEQNLSSILRFYSQKEEDVPEAVVETVSVHIGEEYYTSEVSLEKFEGLVAGYYVGGWKYYRTPNEITGVDISSSFSTNSDGTVSNVKVTPQNVDFLASWNPNTDTKYKVEHYFQTEDLADYTLDEEKTQTLEGTTDTPTQAQPLEQKGFLPLEFIQSNINGDGSGLVKIYYNRKKVTIKIFYDDGRADDGVEFEGYFGQKVADVELPDRNAEALVFNGWKVTYEDGTEDELEEQELTYIDDKAVYTVKWKVIPAEGNVTVTYPAAESDVNLDCTVTVTFVSNHPMGAGTIYSIKCYDATSGYASYSWILDGDLTNIHIGQTLDDSFQIAYGYHSLLLVVTDAAGNSYSKEVVIQVKQE